jgi:hypothetical protein
MLANMELNLLEGPWEIVLQELAQLQEKLDSDQ